MPAGARPIELFLLDLEDEQFVLYAPLRRAAAVVNRGAAGVVARYLEDEHVPLTAAEAETIARLTANGLLGGEEPASPAFPEGYGFAPYEVTLFLTSRCNLRCRYCYAEGGKEAHDLTWDQARAAIDFVAQNAVQSGREDFVVGFHGGGEPTLAWGMLVRCVEYAEARAASAGLRVHIHTATTASERRAAGLCERAFQWHQHLVRWAAGHPNHNRPFADGRGSFDDVMRSLKYFDRQGFPYGVRLTVTRDGTPRMAETIAFLGHTLPG